MTDLISQQLRSMAVMVMCGIAASLVYHVFYQIRMIYFNEEDRPKSLLSRLLDGMLELTSLILAAYIISVFLYYSDRGNIRLQDAVCFFAGLMLWRKANGEERKPSPGVREDTQSAGYQLGSGKPETKEKRKG